MRWIEKWQMEISQSDCSIRLLLLASTDASIELVKCHFNCFASNRKEYAAKRQINDVGLGDDEKWCFRSSEKWSNPIRFSFFASQRKKSEFIRSLNRPDEFLRMKKKKENEFTWSANEFFFFTVDGWDPGVAHFLNYSFTFSQLSDFCTDGRTEGRTITSAFFFHFFAIWLLCRIHSRWKYEKHLPRHLHEHQAVVFIFFSHVVLSWQRNLSESMYLMKLYISTYIVYMQRIHPSVRSTNWKW